MRKLILQDYFVCVWSYEEMYTRQFYYCGPKQYSRVHVVGQRGFASREHMVLGCNMSSFLKMFKVLPIINYITQHYVDHLATLFSFFCYLASLYYFVSLTVIPTYQRMKSQSNAISEHKIIILTILNVNPITIYYFNTSVSPSNTKLYKQNVLYQHTFYQYHLIQCYYFLPLSLFFLLLSQDILNISQTILFFSFFNSSNNLQLLPTIRPNVSLFGIHTRGFLWVVAFIS